MPSPKTRRNLYRILPFGLIWMVSGWVFLIVELAAAGGAGQLPDTAIQMNGTIFLFSSLVMAGVGMLVGAIELVFLEKLFAKNSFFKKILYKLFFYLGLIFMIILITFPLAAGIELGTNPLDSRVWIKYSEYLGSITFLSTLLQLGVAVGLSLFYAEISDNIGQGILLNFFTGKYHRPVEENRIFMFLDMKSSTTIAEQLGHIEYFQLLRAYYADLSDAVVEYAGEIYQYVGDEIIVSWAYEDGIADQRCIRCFFAMKEALRKKTDRYRQRFGLVPTFKAGIHFGKVTTGEIGVIKKEILFSGDVLNATARIQGLCNTYGVDLLLSKDLLESLDLAADYQIRSMGTNILRGRKEAMELYTVS